MLLRSSQGNPSVGRVKRKSLSQIWRRWTCRRLYLGNGARRLRVKLMTDRKSYPVESNGTALDPLGWSRIKILGRQFWWTVRISEVNGARKVKCNAQVAMNKNSNPVQKRSTAEDMALLGWWYIGGPATIHYPHISVLYRLIFCKDKFKLHGISMLLPVYWLSMDMCK